MSEPLYLGLEPDPVFGILTPAAGTPRVAALLLPPFGWEAMVSHRGHRDWAAQLAGAGMPALRIDLPGSGDSGGGPTDPDRVEAWLAAVDGAARWLRERTGCERVAAIGIGLGGLLACCSASRGAPIDDLVLWGVPARGRTLVRELHAFARLERSRMSARGAPEEPPAPDGAIVAGGYLMTAATRAAIEAIDVSALAFDPPPGVLLLERDGVAVDERLAAAFAAAGAQVAVRPGEGYGDLVMGDMVALPPPAATFATVSEWLARDVAAPERRAPAPAPPALTRIELPVGRARVLESAVDLAGLPGVLCEPAAGGGDLCAVLLNAGPQRRIGPNRMWVEIARRWAARGVATVRFDISGIGDADGPRLGATDTDALYAPGHVAQVRAVLDDLQARGTGARFLLLGLCSGANWAFQAALQDDRVRAAVLLNPGALFYDRWTTQARSGRELTRLARLSELRRLLAGEVSPRAPVVAARAIGRWLIAWPMTLRRRWAGRLRGETNPLVAALDRLEAAGRTLDVVFTEQEHLRAELAASGDLAELGRRPGVRLELIASGADAHTLQPLWIQAHVHAHVDAALEHELERAPAREAAPAR